MIPFIFFLALQIAVRNLFACALYFQNSGLIARLALAERSGVGIILENKWTFGGAYFNNDEIISKAEALCAIHLLKGFINHALELHSWEIESSVLFNLRSLDIICLYFGLRSSDISFPEEICNVFRIAI